MAGHQQISVQHLERVLEYHFGYKGFRPGQLQAVQATLELRDSLVILPTGGGKSLCFQLPPLSKDAGFTVVISPLIALARDQASRCQDADIDAELWNCEVSEEKRSSILRDMVSDTPSLKLLIATPEALRNPKLRETLQVASEQGTLVSFAIDEAHCVSEWGHDFRPAYLELASLRSDFPNVPVAAFTASCTKDVQKSIISVLRLKEPLVLQSSFNRPNIEYQVVYKDLLGNGSEEAAVQHLVDFITARKGQCGIIYARLRKTCDWLASVLSSHELDVGCYHAGKDGAQRRKVQSEWSEGSVDVVVATIAFGMGIDKADVRWVVHWNSSSSMEGFYQESGRVGRDGLPSLSVVYASHADLEACQQWEKGCRRGAAQEMAGLLMDPGCRRRKVLKYFGEAREGCGAGEQQCDFCCSPAAVRQQLRQLEAVQQAKVMAQQRPQQQGSREGSQEDADQENAAAAVQKPTVPGWGSATAMRDCSNGQPAAGQAGSRAPGKVPALRQRTKPAAPDQQPPAAAPAGTSSSPVAVAAGNLQCSTTAPLPAAAAVPKLGCRKAVATAQAGPAASGTSAVPQQSAKGVRRAFVPPRRAG